MPSDVGVQNHFYLKKSVAPVEALFFLWWHSAGSSEGLFYLCSLNQGGRIEVGCIFTLLHIVKGKPSVAEEQPKSEARYGEGPFNPASL